MSLSHALSLRFAHDAPYSASSHSYQEELLVVVVEVVLLGMLKAEEHNWG
jgi:hypothetical protein